MILRVIYARYSFSLIFVRYYQIRYLITEVHFGMI